MVCPRPVRNGDTEHSAAGDDSRLSASTREAPVYRELRKAATPINRARNEKHPKGEQRPPGDLSLKVDPEQKPTEGNQRAKAAPAAPPLRDAPTGRSGAR